MFGFFNDKLYHLLVIITADNYSNNQFVINYK